MTDRQIYYAKLAFAFILTILPLSVSGASRNPGKKIYGYTQEYAFSGVRSIIVKSESSKFYRNRMTGEIDVRIVQSRDERVVVSVVRQSDADVFKVEKIGNTLKLNAGDKEVGDCGDPDRPEALVTVYTKDINRIEMGGANELTASGYFTGKSMNLVIYGASQVEGLSGKWSDLNIRLSGAADLSMVKVEAGNVTLKCEDAADFKISGKGKSVKIEASGSADIDAEDFEAVDVEAKLKGAADVTVNVKGTLKYSSTGSADFEWIGNPEIIRK